MSDQGMSDALDRLSRNAPEIARGLRQFTESAQIFSSDAHRLIDSYENKWLAVHKSSIVAVADSLEELTAQIEGKNIPPSEALIRFIDREPTTLIL